MLDGPLDMESDREEGVRDPDRDPLPDPDLLRLSPPAPPVRPADLAASINAPSLPLAEEGPLPPFTILPLPLTLLPETTEAAATEPAPRDRPDSLPEPEPLYEDEPLPLRLYEPLPLPL